MPNYITPKELFDKLIENHILEKSGVLVFNLLGVNVTIKTRDVIGNILQSWLGKWLIQNNYDHSVPNNSQEFPDFYLKTDNKNDTFLEIKSFDLDRSPNFDIANFESYVSSIKIMPERLNADYLIFGYTMDSEGNILIKKLWLKKIWEISTTSAEFPVKVQQKRCMIYNLRPCVWYSNSARFKPFNTKEEFIKAVYLTLKKYSKTAKSADEWLLKFKDNFESKLSF